MKETEQKMVMTYNYDKYNRLATGYIFILSKLFNTSTLYINSVNIHFKYPFKLQSFIHTYIHINKRIN